MIMDIFDMADLAYLLAHMASIEKDDDEDVEYVCPCCGQPCDEDDISDEIVFEIEYEADDLTLPEINKVVFNDPATIVFWEDGTKTVVKCQKDKGDTYSEEVGLAMAIAKKALGNSGRFNDVINKWLGR